MNKEESIKQILYRIILVLIWCLPIFIIDRFGMLLYCSVLAYFCLFVDEQKSNMVYYERNRIWLLFVACSILLSFINVYLEENYIKFIPLIFYYLVGFYEMIKYKMRWIKEKNFEILIPMSIYSIKLFLNERYILEIYGLEYCCNQFLQSIFVAAIPEELFFRGYLFNCLKRKYDGRSARLVSSIFFGIWHLQLVYNLLLNPNLITLFNIVAIIFLGYIATFLEEKYGIIMAIMFHAFVDGAFTYALGMIYVCNFF